MHTTLPPAATGENNLARPRRGHARMPSCEAATEEPGERKARLAATGVPPVKRGDARTRLPSGYRFDFVLAVCDRLRSSCQQRQLVVDPQLRLTILADRKTSQLKPDKPRRGERIPRHVDPSERAAGSRPRGS
jgi:hypothetical protein